MDNNDSPASVEEQIARILRLLDNEGKDRAKYEAKGKEIEESKKRMAAMPRAEVPSTFYKCVVEPINRLQEHQDIFEKEVRKLRQTINSRVQFMRNEDDVKMLMNVLRHAQKKYNDNPHFDFLKDLKLD